MDLPRMLCTCIFVMLLTTTAKSFHISDRNGNDRALKSLASHPALEVLHHISLIKQNIGELVKRVKKIDAMKKKNSSRKETNNIAKMWSYNSLFGKSRKQQPEEVTLTSTIFSDIITTTTPMTIIDFFDSSDTSETSLTTTNHKQSFAEEVTVGKQGKSLTSTSSMDTHGWMSLGTRVTEILQTATPRTTTDIFDRSTTISKKLSTTTNHKLPSAEEVTVASPGKHWAPTSNMDTHKRMSSSTIATEIVPTTNTMITTDIFDSFTTSKKHSTVTNHNQPSAAEVTAQSPGKNWAPTSDMDTGTRVSEILATTTLMTTIDNFDSYTTNKRRSENTDHNQPSSKEVTAASPGKNLASPSSTDTHGWMSHGTRVTEILQTATPRTTTDIFNSFTTSKKRSTATDHNQPSAKEVTAASPGKGLASISSMDTHGWMSHGATITENFPTTISMATSDIFDSFTTSKKPSTATNHNQPSAEEVTASSPGKNPAPPLSMDPHGWMSNGTIATEIVPTTNTIITTDIFDGFITSKTRSTAMNHKQPSAKDVTAASPGKNLASPSSTDTHGWMSHGTTVTEILQTATPITTTDIFDSSTTISKKLSTTKNHKQSFAKEVTIGKPGKGLASSSSTETHGWMSHDATVTENFPTTISMTTSDIFDSFTTSKKHSTATNHNQPSAKEATALSPGKSLTSTSSMDTYGLMSHDATVTENFPTTISMTTSDIFDSFTTSKKRSKATNHNQPSAKEVDALSPGKSLTSTSSMDTHGLMSHGATVTEHFPTTISMTTSDIFDSFTTSKKRSTATNHNQPTAEEVTASSPGKNPAPPLSMDPHGWMSSGTIATEIVSTTNTIITTDIFDGFITSKTRSTATNHNQPSTKEVTAASPGKNSASPSSTDSHRWMSHGTTVTEILQTATPVTTTDIFDGSTTISKKLSTTKNHKQSSAKEVTAASPGKGLASTSSMETHGWMSHDATVTDNFPTTISMTTSDIFDSFTTSQKRSTTKNHKQSSAKEVTAASPGKGLASTSSMETHGWMSHDATVTDNFPTTISMTTSDIFDSFTTSQKRSTATNHNQASAEEVTALSPGKNSAPPSNMDTHGWMTHEATVKENFPTMAPMTTSDIFDSFTTNKKLSTTVNHNQLFTKDAADASSGKNSAPTPSMDKHEWISHGTTVTEILQTATPMTTTDIFDSSTTSKKLPTSTSSMMTSHSFNTSSSAKGISTIRNVANPIKNVPSSERDFSTIELLCFRTSDPCEWNRRDSFPICANYPPMCKRIMSTNHNQAPANEKTVASPGKNWASTSSMKTHGWVSHGTTVTEKFPATTPITIIDIFDSFNTSKKSSTTANHNQSFTKEVTAASKKPSMIANHNQSFTKDVTAASPGKNSARTASMDTHGWMSHGTAVTENFPTTTPKTIIDISDSSTISKNLSAGTISMIAHQTFDTSSSSKEISTFGEVATPIKPIPLTDRDVLTIKLPCYYTSDPCGWNRRDELYICANYPPMCKRN